MTYWEKAPRKKDRSKKITRFSEESKRTYLNRFSKKRRALLSTCNTKQEFTQLSHVCIHNNTFFSVSFMCSYCHSNKSNPVNSSLHINPSFRISLFFCCSTLSYLTLYLISAPLYPPPPHILVYLSSSLFLFLNGL